MIGKVDTPHMVGRHFHSLEPVAQLTSPKGGPLMDTTTPSSAGLPSHEGNYNTLDPHQVFLHSRRELQHPGSPTRSSFTTEGNFNTKRISRNSSP
ncbi:hypothetical protein Taro_023353 [Colocasia esculenta]|uniref:Uncharacterized protein n=1 Tax=Colocasia esculenta TaxID=4460 RepID=A0A843VH42_COLES|nr:hypothetical protein [Colocasia esculenta]